MAVGRIGEYHLGTNASWDEHVERLEMFCEANKIAKEEQKRAVLLICCGEEAYGLIVTLVKPSRPTAATYKEIKMAVHKHLHSRLSELCARFLFYKRNQTAEKSVADYVTALRKLAEDCGFGDEQLPLDIMMRDRFVCSLQNEAVQQRLLAEHDLTFNIAYDMAATAEATAKQQRDIQMQGRDEAKDCQGMIQATRTNQDATAEGSSCYCCNAFSTGEAKKTPTPISRLPAAGDEDEPQPPGDMLLLEAVECAPLQAADIAALIQKDKVLSMVKEWILSGWPSTQLDNKFTPYELDNGERHHRHRNQLRSAWTRLEADPVSSADYHVRLPPTARRPQQLSVSTEAAAGGIRGANVFDSPACFSFKAWYGGFIFCFYHDK
ncbi:uncharacterized protein LOC142559795 [Dermacentor variabilis]|uniref:uncharacterized protein LOC142559795 n=1 Tax=Dermacentor variabilis TaxID=34621 RepID=UPI003F5C5A36